MDRRSFFTTISPMRDRGAAPQRAVSRVQNATAGAEPYSAPLEASDAYHLLRRIGFAPKQSQIKRFIGKTADEAVDTLLGDGSDIQPAPPAWIDEITENPKNADIYTRNGIISRWTNLFGQLQYWWVGQMYSEDATAIEKFTLFWGGHFTSEFSFDEDYLPPQQLYRQNILLRRNRIGNFRTFVQDITLDGAMLVYLGGVLNTNRTANENYARELMELFTMGIGHYSEGDVKENARVLTGWKTAMFKDEPNRNEQYYTSWFLPSDHDVNAKTVMGQTIPARSQDDNTDYLVRTQEINKLIDILFEQRPNEIARFIIRKLYRFFIYSNPSGADEEFIEALVAVFVSNNFALRPVLATMFKSAHFFDQANRGVQIKTPVEFAVGLARQFGKMPGNIISALNEEEQVLIDPPNVAGWPGWHNWLNTTTYPNRVIFARGIIKSMTSDELIAFAKSFDSFEDPSALLDDIVLNMLPNSITSKRRDSYLTSLLQGYDLSFWTQMLAEKEPAAQGLRSLLSAIIKAPDYQLC